MRSQPGHARHRRRKRLLNKAEGFWGNRSRLFRRAKETLIRAWAFATRDRRMRKREFRALWIQRMNAAARLHGLSYSRLIGALRSAEIPVNRKMLAEIAVHDPDGFKAIVEKAQALLKTAS